MKKLEFLWFSAMAPYNSVNHAGGKTHNFYTKSFSGDDRYHVTLLTYCLPEEAVKVETEFQELGIDTELVVHPSNMLAKLFWKAMNAETILNPFNRYCGLTRNQTAIRMIHRLREMKKRGYDPDVILLHWTQINLLAEKVKGIYPNAKIIEMEVDVTYLGYERRRNTAENPVQKAFWNYRFQKMKQKELKSLTFANGVIVNNTKDSNLLLSENVKAPIFIWAPFFQSLKDVFRGDEISQDILFYGAMSRDENWKSAIWFVENVMPLIQDLDIRFLIVGSHPDAHLLKYESEKVHILGFVEDIKPLFEHSLCLAAPLVLGAGIKVKIIEALSSGLPVLTNNIGIEGIPANDGIDYFHCEHPEEYADVIKKLYYREINTNEISRNGRKLVSDKLDYNKDAVRLREWIYETVCGVKTDENS